MFDYTANRFTNWRFGLDDQWTAKFSRWKKSYVDARNRLVTQDHRKHQSVLQGTHIRVVNNQFSISNIRVSKNSRVLINSCKFNLVWNKDQNPWWELKVDTFEVNRARGHWSYNKEKFRNIERNQVSFPLWSKFFAKTAYSPSCNYPKDILLKLYYYITTQA